MIRLGGATDSTAALVGALAGLRHDASSWPRAWADDLLDWPRSRAANVYPLALARNLAFLAIALTHALRRGLPPYR